MNLSSLLTRAAGSPWQLRLLNIGLHRMIPFNGPHRLKISKIEERAITITCPYIRKNMNHLKGIHACALATLCEYTCGLSLVRFLSPDKYRLILKSLTMHYHYQARMPVNARYELNEKEESDIRGHLDQNESLVRLFEVKVFDEDENHICTATAEWQLKRWEKVKSK